MEKIPVSRIIGKRYDDTLSYFMLTANNDKIYERIKGDIVKNDNGELIEDNRYFEVELKINGIDVKFSDFIDRIDKQWDHMIKMEAKEILAKTIGDFDTVISNTTEAIKEAMLRISKEKGIVVTDEDYF